MAKIVISGKEMEEAEVVWFNPQKLYGFARVYRTGEEIFFHFNDGRLTDFDEKIENFIFKNAANSKALQYPRIGDQIFFARSKGKKGPKASPWTPVDDFITVECLFADLNQVCDCGHKNKDHSCGECMVCDCGHDYGPFYEDEPRIVNVGGDPGGFTICE